MTESFTVDSKNNVTMQMQIYPTGDNAENKGNVSVFLANESNYDIQIDFTLKMKKGDEAEEYSFSKVDFRGRDVKGKGCSLNFRRGAEHVGNDDETKISCTIKNLKNETQVMEVVAISDVCHVDFGEAFSNEYKDQRIDINGHQKMHHCSAN